MDKEDKGHLSRDDLIAIPELAINPLADRIVDLFLPTNASDSSSTQCKFLKFCEILAHFRPCNSKTKDEDPNSRISKTRLIFNTFDRDHNSRVTRDELLEILRLMVIFFFGSFDKQTILQVGTNIGEDQLVAIAERAIVEAKQNLDGPQVNFRT